MITDGEFINLLWEHTTKILYCITKTNQGWYTWEVDRSVDTYSICEKRALDTIVAKQIAKLRTKIGFIMNQIIVIGEEKVNMVGSPGKVSRNKKSNIMEKPNILIER